MKSSKIILANSVGIDQNELAIIHSPSRWTNSSTDHKVFTYYPWELAYASTLLKRETKHRVKLIDGCLQKFNHARFLEAVTGENPDYFVMEPSTRTWEDDKRLALAVKKECGAKLIMVGQHASAQPEVVSAVADFVLFGEYEMTLLDFFRGMDPQDILGLYPNKARALLDLNLLPFPEDDDVSRLDYAYPGEPSSEYVEIQAYATRGCPLSCSYCVCRHVYYAKENFRYRDPENVVDELVYLKNKYPAMEGIFFDEEYHNASKRVVMNLAQSIKRRGMEHLKIDAMCAYRTLDRESMEAMKEAGYYMIRFGIETASETVAGGITLGRKHDMKKLQEVVRIAKDLDIKLYATFTFGATNSTMAEDQKTLDLMTDLVEKGYLWRFQTSICTPQPGTPYYKWAQEKGFLKATSDSDFDGGNNSVMDYPNYPKQEIEQMYDKAQKVYDIGLKKRFESGIYGNVEKRKEEFSGEKKVLILRTTRTIQLLEAFRALKDINPLIQTDVLVQEEFARDLQEFSLSDTVYTYGNVFFDKETFPEELLQQLQSENYDDVIIVYANTQGRDYENVVEVAEMISPQRVIAMTAKGEIEILREMTKV